MLDYFINMKENHACTSYHVNWKGGVILGVFFWIWKSYSILIEKSAVFLIWTKKEQKGK